MKKCKDIMTINPKCFSPSDTIRKGALQMREEDIGSVLICEPSSGKLLGIVTDRDITVKNVASGLSSEATLDSVATWNPTCCREDDDLKTAFKQMAEHQVRRLPIVDDIGRLTGIISQGDIATRSEESKKAAELVKEVSSPATEQYRLDH